MGCGEDEDTQEEDSLLWKIVTRDVEPYERKKETRQTDSSQNKIKSAKKRDIESKIPETIDASKSFYTDKAQQKLPDIDRRTDEKLRRGQMKIDASLDLHGMTKNEALEALQSFLPSCYESGRRNLLVITGKGRSSERPGVLKEHVPQWLQEMPLLQYVLQFHWARPKDGGDGALYILLRKKR